MKRKIAIVLALIAVGAGCMACGKQGADQGPQNAVSSVAQAGDVPDGQAGDRPDGQAGEAGNGSDGSRGNDGNKSAGNGSENNDGNNAGSGTEGNGGEQAAFDGMRVTVASHRVESADMAKPEGEEAFPYAYIVYPELLLSEESKAVYPELAARLESDNEEIRNEAMEELSNATELASEGVGAWLHTSNERNAAVEVFRADERMFGYLVIYDGYYNGAHPDMWYRSVAYDPRNGEQLPLADVVTDMKALPQILLEHLTPIDETYVFDEAENADMLTKLERMVAENELVWTLDSAGFHAYFDAYDLQFYAFGPIFADIPLSEYPDLFVEDYLPAADGENTGAEASLEERISYEEAGTQTFRWEELEQYHEAYQERMEALYGVG